MARIQSWEVSDSFWKKVALLIPSPERDPQKAYKRKAGGGRKPMPPRQIFEAIIYVLRTGCQWKALASVDGFHVHGKELELLSRETVVATFSSED